MNEDRKKRGIKNHKILMTVAICALFLGSSNTFAARSTSHENHGVTEQMQSVAVNVLVVDAQGEPIIGANVVEKEKESTAPVEVVEEEEVVEEVTPVSKPRTSNVSTRAERINAAQGEDASRLKRYSVVIGSFKNKTNAYALKERMQNDGYNAVLGENEQGMLRVIVASFNDKADAADSRDAIKAKYAPNFQDAWILERQY